VSEQEVRCPYCNAVLILKPLRRVEVRPEPATPRQIEYICLLCQKAGREIPSDIDKLTKEEASKLIEELKALKPK